MCVSTKSHWNKKVSLKCWTYLLQTKYCEGELPQFWVGSLWFSPGGKPWRIPAVPWNGLCPSVVASLDQVNSSLLLFCYLRKQKSSHWRHCVSFIVGKISLAFRLLTCPVCPVSGVIPSLSMVAIFLSFSGSWVWDFDFFVPATVWTVLCLLEIILQAQLTSVFISPLFSLLSKKKFTAWQPLFLTPGSNHVSKVQQSSDCTTVTFSTQGLLDYSAATPKVTSVSELI